MAVAASPSVRHIFVLLVVAVFLLAVFGALLQDHSDYDISYTNDTMLDEIKARLEGGDTHLEIMIRGYLDTKKMMANVRGRRRGFVMSELMQHSPSHGTILRTSLGLISTSSSDSDIYSIDVLIDIDGFRVRLGTNEADDDILDTKSGAILTRTVTEMGLMAPSSMELLPATRFFSRNVGEAWLMWKYIVNHYEIPSSAITFVNAEFGITSNC
jgi:hypothetical protein